MFKRIAIELTGPLCACLEMRLSWGITRPASKPGEPTAKAGLFLRCNGCGTTLTVPHKHFVATFRLDEPYPGIEEEEEDSPRLEVLEGGKLLKFDTTDSDEKPRDDESRQDV